MLAIGLTCVCPAAELYVRQSNWAETMLAARAALDGAPLSGPERSKAVETVWFRLKDDFPVQWDWALQDGREDAAQWLASAGTANFERATINKVLAELDDSDQALRQEVEQLSQSTASVTDRRWLDLYVKACEQRRKQRLRALPSRVVFTKHRTIRPSFFAYTEGQSDAQDERHFLPGSALCLLEMDGAYGKVAHAAGRSHGRHPRSGGVVGRPARAVRLEEIAERG